MEYPSYMPDITSSLFAVFKTRVSHERQPFWKCGTPTEAIKRAHTYHFWLWPRMFCAVMINLMMVTPMINDIVPLPSCLNLFHLLSFCVHFLCCLKLHCVLTSPSSNLLISVLAWNLKFCLVKGFGTVSLYCHLVG